MANRSLSFPNNRIFDHLGNAMFDVTTFDRRKFLKGGVSLSALALAGCQDAAYQSASAPDPTVLYQALPEEPYTVRAIAPEEIHPGYYRREIRNPYDIAPGTLYVDTSSFYLYYAMPEGRAMRYGVGLGKAGFGWAGQGVIGAKRTWPRWYPPAEMIAREPRLERWSFENGGHPPGNGNPLGARGLYIYQDGVDTLYRVHSSPEVMSIGRAVSSGCVRMVHQDIIDLYNRVEIGSPIIVA